MVNNRKGRFFMRISIYRSLNPDFDSYIVEIIPFTYIIERGIISLYEYSMLDRKYRTIATLADAIKLVKKRFPNEMDIRYS
jgi:hypothetical protein